MGLAFTWETTALCFGWCVTARCMEMVGKMTDKQPNIQWLRSENERLRKTNERLMTEKLAHMERIYELYMENEKLKKELVEG